MACPLTVTEVEDDESEEASPEAVADDWDWISFKVRAGDDCIDWALGVWLSGAEAWTRYRSKKTAAATRTATATNTEYLFKGKTEPTLTIIPLKTLLPQDGPIVGWFSRTFCEHLSNRFVRILTLIGVNQSIFEVSGQ